MLSQYVVQFQTHNLKVQTVVLGQLSYPLEFFHKENMSNKRLKKEIPLIT